MKGHIGKSEGRWYYVVQLGRIAGVVERVHVVGFESEESARRALEAADLADLRSHAQKLQERRLRVLGEDR